ncbi:MAG: sigma-54 interaction domain-containing protein [Planctomycetaceae bacterium]
MIHPSIVLLTENQHLATRLSDRLAGDCRILHCNWPFDRFGTEAAAMRPDVLVVDFTIVSSGGHAEDRALHDVQQSHPRLPLVMVTLDDCPEILARRAACTDLIHVSGSPADYERIVQAVRASLPRGPVDSQSRAPESPEGLSRRFETNMPSLKWMLQELEIAAAHNVTILLIGETGVGKTYLARLIHEVSPRRDEPFVTVACGALPGELVESELFGHVKGAFTGAHADKDGKFVAAAGGTVLLDEIDVLEPEQQVKLLRAIETGEFEPVGSNTTVTSRARLVVASNLDLQPLVERGRFRPDLYYRLNMLKFEIPPLRERRADVEPLTRTFVRRLSQKHGVTIDGIDGSVIPMLQAYPWPGNVRELENVLRRAVIFCSGGVLKATHLPPNVLFGEPGPTNAAHVNLQTDAPTAPEGRTLGGQIRHKEREIIRQTLTSNNQSRTQTAKELGISRVTLYNKMRKYDLV